MSDDGEYVDVRALQCLARGQYVAERVVVIGGPQGNVGQCSEVSVVPATVERYGGVALRRIQLMATAWGNNRHDIHVYTSAKCH